MSDPRYLVHTGDVENRFKFGCLYRFSQLQRIFNERLRKVKPPIFEGLVLKDSEGLLWKVQVQITLIPETRHDLPQSS
jgi:hypothetical protein